ncbi:hypothetical protein [Microbacterium sp. ZW T5_56]|uniref:hypothetical protein n=1 Tax=Microbacterium sp. ZW T5_56 TaxID=3378081 RepID=UPI003854B0F9
MTNETTIEIPSFTLNGCAHCNSTITIHYPRPNHVTLDVIHTADCPSPSPDELSVSSSDAEVA